MTAAVAAIAVALIGGPIMWFLARFDRRNTSQHEQNHTSLTRIEGKLDRHDQKLDRLEDKLDMHRIDPKAHK